MSVAADTPGAASAGRGVFRVDAPWKFFHP